MPLDVSEQELKEIAGDQWELDQISAFKTPSGIIYFLVQDDYSWNGYVALTRIHDLYGIDLNHATWIFTDLNKLKVPKPIGYAKQHGRYWVYGFANPSDTSFEKAHEILKDFAKQFDKPELFNASAIAHKLSLLD